MIGEAEAVGFLRTKPVGLIWGVGKAFAATLARDGITEIGQLQQMDEIDPAPLRHDGKTALFPGARHR